MVNTLLSRDETLSIFALIAEGKAKAQTFQQLGCELTGIKEGNFLAQANRNLKAAQLLVLKTDYGTTYGTTDDFDAETAIEDKELWSQILEVDDPEYRNVHLPAWESALAVKKEALGLWRKMNKAYLIPNAMFTFLLAILKPEDTFIAVNRGNGSQLFCYNVVVGDVEVMAVCPYNRLNESYHRFFSEVVKNYKSAAQQACLFEGVLPADYDLLLAKFTPLAALLDATSEIPETAGDGDVIVE
jgi:hypothetical protein